MPDTINYPKWIYHISKSPVIVQSREEQDEFGIEWREFPFTEKEKQIAMAEDQLKIAEEAKKKFEHKRFNIFSFLKRR